MQVTWNGRARVRGEATAGGAISHVDEIFLDHGEHVVDGALLHRELLAKAGREVGNVAFDGERLLEAAKREGAVREQTSLRVRQCGLRSESDPSVESRSALCTFREGIIRGGNARVTF